MRRAELPWKPAIDAGPRPARRPRLRRRFVDAVAGGSVPARPRHRDRRRRRQPRVPQGCVVRQPGMGERGAPRRSRRDRLHEARGHGRELDPLLAQPPDLRRRRRALRLQGRGLDVDRSERGLGQGARHPPHLQHARPPGGLPVERRGWRVVDRRREPGSPHRAVDRDRAPLRRRTDHRRLRPRQRARAGREPPAMEGPRRADHRRDPVSRHEPHHLRRTADRGGGRFQSRRGHEPVHRGRPERRLRVPLLRAAATTHSSCSRGITRPTAAPTRTRPGSPASPSSGSTSRPSTRRRRRPGHPTGPTTTAPASPRRARRSPLASRRWSARRSARARSRSTI